MAKTTERWIERTWGVDGFVNAASFLVDPSRTITQAITSSETKINTLASASANYNNTYSTVATNSASWGTSLSAIYWGDISGYIGNQSDLLAILNAKVPTYRSVNSKQLSADITITKSDVGLSNVLNVVQLTSSDVGVANGICPLNSLTKIPSAYLDLGDSTAIALFVMANSARWNNPSWGTISGTLSAQTDLKNALALKLDSTVIAGPSGRWNAVYSTVLANSSTWGGTTSWGNILGDITLQSDLSSRLNGIYNTKVDNTVFNSATARFENCYTTVNSRSAIWDANTGGGEWGSISGTLSAQTDLNNALSSKVPMSLIGAVSGIAPLDQNSLIPMQYLPTSVMEYKGAWNALTNTPTLSDGSGNNGDTYRTSVSGSQTFGGVSATYYVGDFLVYSGASAIWQRFGASGGPGVSSVNGRTGDVTLSASDVNLGNVDNVSVVLNYVANTRKIMNAALSADVTLSGLGFTSAVFTDTTRLLINGSTDGIKITSGDNTHVNVVSGHGLVWCNNEQRYIPVSWNNFLSIIPSGQVISADSTYMLITSGGNLVQQTTEPLGLDVRNNIYLGKVAHRNGNPISVIRNFAWYADEPFDACYDLAKAIGSINVNGNVYSANGANLQLNKTNGNCYRFQVNADQNRHEPSYTSESPLSSLSFGRCYRNVAGTGVNFVVNQTTIDPNYYDVNGALSAVGNNNWSIQRIYMFPRTNSTYVFYGQNQYGTKAEALANLVSETFTFTSEFFLPAVFRGWLVINQGASNLSSTSQAVFLPANKFSSATGGAGGLPNHATLHNATGIDPLTGLSCSQITISQSGVILGRDSTSGICQELKHNFYTTMTSSSLSGTQFRVNHMLNDQYPTWAIYNNINKFILPTDVIAESTSSLLIETSGQVVSGTWKIKVTR